MICHECGKPGQGYHEHHKERDPAFIKWLYMRDHGEQISTERLERAYKEWQAR